MRAGFLDTRHGDPELVAAILADTGLSERQKQALIDIYEAFRRENLPSAHDEPAGPDDERAAEQADERQNRS